MSNMHKGLAILSGLGLLAGAWGVGEALVYGTHATALGSYIPWGLGVIFYLFFLGLSAGGFLLSIMTTVFGMKQYESLSGIAAWTVLVTEVCAGIAIATDLGHWERMYRFIITPSLTSPMMWMFILFNALLVIYVLKSLFLATGNGAMSKMMTWLSLPVALLFYGTNGFFFSIVSSHPVWNSGLVPVMFIIAALLSGGALLTFLAWAWRREARLVTGLGRAVLFLLVVFLILEALHVFVGYQSGRPEAVAALDAMLTGQNWWSFWGVHIGLGFLVPIVILAVARNNPAAVAWTCLLIVVAFLAYRWAFTISAQTVPMLPGLDQAFVHERLRLAYSPNLGEWLAALFVVSLSILGFLFGPRLFPALFKEGDTHVQA